MNAGGQLLECLRETGKQDNRGQGGVDICCGLLSVTESSEICALTLSPFVWKRAERLLTRLYMEHCNGTLHCYLDTPMSYMTMYSHCIQNICVYTCCQVNNL